MADYKTNFDYRKANLQPSDIINFNPCSFCNKEPLCCNKDCEISIAEYLRQKWEPTLKRCPFCMRDNIKMIYEKERGWTFICQTCLTTVSFPVADKLKAIEKWNREEKEV